MEKTKTAKKTEKEVITYHKNYNKLDARLHRRIDELDIYVFSIVKSPVKLPSFEKEKNY